MTRWYNFERLPRIVNFRESFRILPTYEKFYSLKRIRTAHWHILYCCIHCRNGYGCTYVRFYQRNVTIKTTKLISLPVSYAHSKIKINSNQEKHVLFLLQFKSTVSGSYFLVRWVISLPSVWRSSVTRSWSPVTITWSVAIAGSWPKNTFDQMFKESFKNYLLELSGASKSLYFFFFFSFLSFLSFFSFFFFSFRGGDGTGDSYPSPVLSSAD